MLRDDQSNARVEDYVTSSFQTITSVKIKEEGKKAAGVSRQILSFVFALKRHTYLSNLS